MFHKSAKSFEDYAKELNVDLSFLDSDDSDIQAPAIPLDAGHPLSHYYISSSHNTYLTGNQLYGKATAEAYRKVLDRGCRCVEIDVWNGDELASHDAGDESSQLASLSLDNVSKRRPERIEPRVLHGHTATKECSFREVVQTIREDAFSKTDTPLIVSLELHTSREQQKIMVEIMNEYWSEFLVKNEGFAESTPLPNLDALRRKILIKVKYSDPKPKSAKDHGHLATNTEDSSDDEPQDVNAAKAKIIPELGSMGVYTRSYHFSSFDQPEAHIPTHVFSMSERKISTISSTQPDRFFLHNRTYLLRAYPKGLRIDSSNLDPAPFWRLGVQMAALNWQHVNEGTMLNHAMFAGTEGYVLKPPGHRDPKHQSLVAATPLATIDLAITLLAGQELGAAAAHHKPHPYVKMELHVSDDAEAAPGQRLPADGRAKEGQYKRRGAAESGRDPDFGGETLSFKGVKRVAVDTAFLRFKVQDDEPLRRDELLGWACVRLGRVRDGVRVVRLLDSEGNESGGRLLVKVEIKIVPQ